ncbi:hypothetical protein D3C86_2221410 [compost metagenome]
MPEALAFGFFQAFHPLGGALHGSHFFRAFHALPFADVVFAAAAAQAQVAA